MCSIFNADLHHQCKTASLSPLIEELICINFSVTKAPVTALPTGLRWNRKSRTRARIFSFSNVTLRNTGSSSCNARNRETDMQRGLVAPESTDHVLSC